MHSSAAGESSAAPSSIEATIGGHASYARPVAPSAAEVSMNRSSCRRHFGNRKEMLSLKPHPSGPAGGLSAQ